MRKEVQAFLCDNDNGKEDISVIPVAAQKHYK